MATGFRGRDETGESGAQDGRSEGEGMSPLVKIRSERDQMSAVERRIADFLLENAQLLRDYSSQLLANALGVSQSSVVKFSQKLGFKGYPDLKYSIGEAIGRAEHTEGPQETAVGPGHRHHALATELWRRKSEAEEATRLINSPGVVQAVADLLGRAGRVFLMGLGEDGIPARTFAQQLSMLGISTVQDTDVTRMTAHLSAMSGKDVLVVFSEQGTQPVLCQVSHFFHEGGGRVITVTRHTTNPLRSLADIALLVSAHAEPSYLSPLLYQSALQHLLDSIFVLLCESDSGRLAQWLANVERIRTALES